MEIDDPKIVALREQVTAAQQEFDMAVAFHEVWKPATYDGTSTAAWDILCFTGFPRHADRTPARDAASADAPMGHQQAGHSDAMRLGYASR